MSKPKYNFKDIINRLEKTPAQKHHQNIHGIIVGIALLCLCLVPGILVALEQKVAAFITIIVCFVAIAISTVTYKHRIYHDFYQVRNAQEKVHIDKITDIGKIKELCDSSALTFVAPPEPEILNFIYNWLHFRQLLKRETLTIYSFTGQQLHEAFDFTKLHPETILLCINLTDLNRDKNDSQKFRTFVNEHLIVNSNWLDDLVDNQRA